MRDVNTAALRALIHPEAHGADLVLTLADALDDARRVRRDLRRRLAAAEARLDRVRALPRFPDDDDPGVEYVLATSVDDAIGDTA